MRIRVVFDCMVFLQGAARADGPAAACLRLAEAGHVGLFLSAEILDEVRDVLTRPKIQRKFPSLTHETIEAFLARLGHFGHLVAEIPSVNTLERDPKDEKYLDLAAAAGVNYLVAWDKDLLDLMDDPGSDAQTFRARCPNVTILDPVAFLSSLPVRDAERPPVT